MEAIIKTIESEIEKADWNINYHRKHVEEYEQLKDKLTLELTELKQLIDEPLPNI